MINQFPGKILLFGEYAIIKGAQGFAIPFDRFYGELEYSDHSSLDESLKLNQLCEYLADSSILGKELDIERFKQDIEKGLFFNSNIPYGHGLGSSGALCAAIFEKYSVNLNNAEENHQDLKYLQDLMALMESYYHGTSSGLDCLISYVKKPVLIEARHRLKTLQVSPKLSDLGEFYLLESHIIRKTSPFVHKFLNMYEESSDFKLAFGEFINFNNSAIKALLENNKENFKKSFYEISKFQYLNMSEMIPDKIKRIWLEGLETKEYFVKLCGAGGGGYFLIYSLDKVFNGEDYLKIS